MATRFYRWVRVGVWERVLRELQRRADTDGEVDRELHHVDGSVVRAHQHAAGAQKGSSVCQAALAETARRSDLSFWKTASEMRRLRHRSASLPDLPSAIFLR